MTNWNMRPLGVQVLALAYRTGEAWNETAYSNPEFDAKLNAALAVADADQAQGNDEGYRADPAGFRHHHPALLAQALQPLGRMQVKNYGMHPTFEHDYGKVWLDQA